MTAIARVVMLMLLPNGLQRWLMMIGLGLAVLGLTPEVLGWYPDARPALVLLTLLGAVFSVIGPVVAGSLICQAVAAPRSVQLIPYGRLKVVLGACLTQLLVAGWLTLVLNAVNRTPVAGLYLLLFAGLTAFFFTFYCVLQFRFGALIIPLWLLVPRAATLAFPDASPQWYLIHRFLAALLAASAFAWVTLALVYSRARRLHPPLGNTVGLVSAPRTVGVRRVVAVLPPSRMRALEVILTGAVHFRRSLFRFALLLCGLFVVGSLLGSARATNDLLRMWAYLICLFAGAAPGLFASIAARRAKYLWLVSGLDREALFGLVEQQCWRTVLLVATMALVAASALLGASLRGGVPLTVATLSLLTAPLISGTALTYVGLTCIRGRRWGDIVLVFGCMIMPMVELVSLRKASFLALPVLLALQVLAIPVLRQLARARWQRIDWMIHPPGSSRHRPA